MTSDHSYIERLFICFPDLRKLEGFPEVIRNWIDIEQIPISFSKPENKWSLLAKEHELRWILEKLLMELLPWHREKLKRTPPIEYMDKTFQEAGCCPLSYLISGIGLFEGSYQKLLIQSNLTPNHKTRKHIRRDSSKPNKET